MSSTAYKWVPVVEHDACTGCGLCINACDRACLELVWDFATLKRPADCGSCGHCQAACQHDVIRMGWEKTTGNRAVGRWQDQLEPPATPVQPGHWLLGLFGKAS